MYVIKTQLIFVHWIFFFLTNGDTNSFRCEKFEQSGDEPEVVVVAPVCVQKQQTSVGASFPSRAWSARLELESVLRAAAALALQVLQEMLTCPWL